MERKHNLNNINLSIEDIQFISGFKRNGQKVHDGCMIVGWSSNIGFGEYTIALENGNLVADSETMDNNEDKDFCKLLFSKIIEKLIIDS